MTVTWSVRLLDFRTHRNLFPRCIQCGEPALFSATSSLRQERLYCAACTTEVQPAARGAT